VLIQDEIHNFSEMVEDTVNQEADHGSDGSDQKGRLLKQPVEVFIEVENMIYVLRKGGNPSRNFKGSGRVEGEPTYN
jgi:hypothetical protein